MPSPTTAFPRAHAASFALLVYASAYLKHYYAPEFSAAILNAQPMGFYSPGTLIEDAKRHGVTVLPVDASRSRYDSTIEPLGDGFAVRLGLRLVRGIGGKARELLQRAVESGGTVRVDRRCGATLGARPHCAALAGGGGRARLLRAG